MGCGRGNAEGGGGGGGARQTKRRLVITARSLLERRTDTYEVSPIVRCLRHLLQYRPTQLYKCRFSHTVNDLQNEGAGGRAL